MVHGVSPCSCFSFFYGSLLHFGRNFIICITQIHICILRILVCGKLIAEIIRNYPLVTVRRNDTEDSLGTKKIEEYRRKYDADITLLHMKPVDVSSSLIRAGVADGRPITGLVTPETEEYIIEHKLYR